MPKDALQKIASFVKFCENQRLECGFSLSNIVNMDETPIWADMPSETTVEIQCMPSIRLESISLLLPKSQTSPYLFDPHICQFIIRNDELTNVWVEEVWGSLAFGKRFLVWDSFKCHISDEMKETVRKMKTVMGVIPGGCTKFLQPLDVSINKPFKAAFRALYDE